MIADKAICRQLQEKQLVLDGLLADFAGSYVGFMEEISEQLREKSCPSKVDAASEKVYQCELAFLRGLGDMRHLLCTFSRDYLRDNPQRRDELRSMFQKMDSGLTQILGFSRDLNGLMFSDFDRTLEMLREYAFPEIPLLEALERKYASDGFSNTAHRERIKQLEEALSQACEAGKPYDFL